MNELCLSPVHDHNGALTHYIGVQNDISERVIAEERISFLAHNDPLTQLPNRAFGLAEITRHLDARRPIAVLYCDLDGFKAINDRHGHAAGDAVLRTVARRLRGTLRSSDALVRHGGDEFLVILTDLGTSPRAVAETTARHLRTAMNDPLTHEGLVHRLRISIGISHAPHDATSTDALVAHADAAMYFNKHGSHLTTPRKQLGTAG